MSAPAKIVGLTLRQPWASLISICFKKDEIRKWKTNYRGLVAVHAGVNFTRYEKGVCLQEPVCSALEQAGLFDPEIRRSHGRHDFSRLQFGAIIATMRITDCLDVDSHPNVALLERALKEDCAGQYAFQLAEVKLLSKPIPYRKGFLGFWTVPPEICEQIAAVSG
jgi:hypothetical protein